jgi:hypothetical protein
MSRTCSVNEIVMNATFVKNHIGTKIYGPVDVLITDRSRKTTGEWVIEFIEYGQMGNPDAPRHKAEWANPLHVWVACPSTISDTATATSAGDPPDPATNPTGRMYIHRDYADAPALHIKPKWPDELPQPESPAQRTLLYPLSLTLIAIELESGDHVQGTVELLDRDLASRSQSIELDGVSPIAIDLTESGRGAFALDFTPNATDVQRAVEVLEGPRDHPPDVWWALRVVAAYGESTRGRAQTECTPPELDRRVRTFLYRKSE